MMATVRAFAVAMLLLGAASMAPAAEANKPLLDSAARQQPGAIKLWERLVNIDSGTSTWRASTRSARSRSRN